MKVFIIIYYIIFGARIYSQEMFQESYEYYSKKIILESQFNWDNSFFGPLRNQTSYQKFPNLITESVSFSANDTLMSHNKIGFYSVNDQIALYGNFHWSYKYFYAYLYPRIVSDTKSFARYTGIPRDISRYNFNSGETDISGIGYEKDWFIGQIGRGRQSWGYGSNIQLALSEDSPSYDYFLIGISLGNIKTRYFHGFLETRDIVNRYITGRGVEWYNKRNLKMAISEITVYSGENRPLDFAYLNPASTHLEVELNDRQNRLGTDSGNAVWQCSFQYLFMPNITISANLLYDEYVLDDKEKQAGKVHGKAFSFSLMWNIYNKASLINAYISTMHVGSYTFRHEDGNNNFIIRNKPLGWNIGSDAEEVAIGLNYFNKKNIIIELSTGLRNIGSRTIIDDSYDPYDSYMSGPFPSGTVNNISFISSKFIMRKSRNLMFYFSLDVDSSRGSKNNTSIKSGIDLNINMVK